MGGGVNTLIKKVIEEFFLDVSPVGEHLVEIPPHIVANGYHRAVHEGYPRELPEGIQPHEQQHVDEHPRHELHEAVVGDGVGKITSHPSKHAVQVVLLEVAVSAEMVADENGHYLAPGEPSLTVPVPFAVTGFMRRGEVFSHFHV